LLGKAQITGMHLPEEVNNVRLLAIIPKPQPLRFDAYLLKGTKSLLYLDLESSVRQEERRVMVYEDPHY
jgi:hypothetical protein